MPRVVVFLIIVQNSLKSLTYNHVYRISRKVRETWIHAIKREE